MCYPFVELNHPSRNHAQYSRVFPCPLHTVFSFIIALYSHKIYLLPCIVFVLTYIPVPLYIYPLLPYVVFVLPYIPLLFYIYPLLHCIVFSVPYIPVPFYISPVLPCIAFVLPYIPVPSTYPLYCPCIAIVLPYIPVPSTYLLYFLVSSLYSHISPYTSSYTLYSLVSSFFSHISPALLHIPSTPLCRLCTPIYPLTLLHISGRLRHESPMIQSKRDGRWFISEHLSSKKMRLC